MTDIFDEDTDVSFFFYDLYGHPLLPSSKCPEVILTTFDQLTGDWLFSQWDRVSDSSQLYSNNLGSSEVQIDEIKLSSFLRAKTPLADVIQLKPLFRLMNLNSSHFPRVYNSLVVDEKLLTISEKVEGVPVTTYFDSEEAPKEIVSLEEKVIDLLIPFLDALEQLHKIGIVHSNINIGTLLVNENRFVLTDLPLYLLYSGERCRPTFPDYPFF